MPPKEFINNYHFVPLEQDLAENIFGPPASADDFRTGNFTETRFNHGRYQTDADHFHGRIICRLEVETPLIVGSEQDKPDENSYTFVKPFQIDDEPAIPASSLKGMISSLAEAASGSALRVLHPQTPVSYRQPARNALSALGRIVQKNGEMYLQPLSPPLVALETTGGSSTVRFGFDASKKDAWARIFESYINLKSYIGSYIRHTETPRGLREEESFDEERFLKSIYIRNRNNLERLMRNNYFYMKVHQGGPLADFPEMIEANPTGFKQKYFRSAQWILSQYPKDATHSGTPSEGSCAGDYLDGRLIGKCEYDDLPESEKEEYTRGFLRIISASVRKMPGKNKKHELFIPYPERAENLAPMLNIERSALEKFYGLADELVELDKAKTINSPNERRPYTPLDTVERLRAERNSVSSVRLRDGHIVYFDINKEGNVCDISFSAIWRGAVKMNNNEESLVASMHDFFPAELRPYNSKRETISLAEWMFGFVEQRNIGTSIALGTSGDENGIARRAYSGRIRFSTARIDPKQKQGSISDYFVNGDVPYPNPGQKPDFAAVDYVALRELSSPKPPSPQLYFKRSNLEPRPIEKVELAPLRHVPQGRKMYLHIPSAYEDPDNCEGKPWLTGKDVADGGKRRCAVRPVRCRTVFWFHLDFDNLHKNELELLCFALQPSEAFRHKLGMGKSIGLGSVQIEPVALCLINRKSRYSEANSLFSPRRYSEVHFNSEQAISDLPDKYYLREKLCRTALSKEPKTPKYFAEIYRQRIQGTDTSKALELIGEPEHAKSMAGDGVEVCPPYSSGKEPWGEDDTYEWFANNDSHFNIKAACLCRPFNRKRRKPLCQCLMSSASLSRRKQPRNRARRYRPPSPRRSRNGPDTTSANTGKCSREREKQATRKR